MFSIKIELLHTYNQYFRLSNFRLNKIYNDFTTSIVVHGKLKKNHFFVYLLFNNSPSGLKKYVWNYVNNDKEFGHDITISNENTFLLFFFLQNLNRNDA